MGIGWLCKMFPVCFPHEMLGFPRDDLKGILISLKIAKKISKAENPTSRKGKQAQRRAKFNKGSMG